MAWGIIGASALSAGASYFGQSKANVGSVGMSDKQMAFQERMSSTAHQREVVDLRRAGLNPMLSVMGGGASAPSGSQGVINSELEGVAASAKAMPRLAADLKAVKASTEVSNKQAGLLSAQTIKTLFDAGISSSKGVRLGIEAKGLQWILDRANEFGKKIGLGSGTAKDIKGVYERGREKAQKATRSYKLERSKR